MARSHVDQDKLDRYINGFAIQSFRDQADRDYIAARLACRYGLYPQFLWASQQAVEKYLKAILLFNRIKASKVRHDIAEALRLTDGLSFKIELSDSSKEFIDHLAQVGEYRYLDVPYHVRGHILIDLDHTVWEIRRYCQVLDVFGKALPDEEQVLLEEAKVGLARSNDEPRHKFKISGGLLEKFIQDRKSQSRPALLWQNPCFGSRNRATVRSRNLISAQNSLLYLYPEMLEELIKYVYIPSHLKTAYRQHLVEIQKGKKKRP